MTSAPGPHQSGPTTDQSTGQGSGPPPGLTVGGYELLARIGEGGMGVVHLARQPGGDRVALKVIRPHIVGDDEARERLAREVKSLRRIRSRRVAEIVDADPYGEIPFVATRYVPGLSLAEHMVEEGPLHGDDLIWFAWCLAEALSDVHACGVLHRDVKPSNVLMEGRSPVLIDFGLARVADDPRLTHTGWLLGTPGYLAPEILLGKDATVASDVHSWAATVAYAGIGRSPFGTGPSAAIMDRVRRGEHDLTGLQSPLLDVIAAALGPDPLTRPTLPSLLSWLRRQVGDGKPANGIDRGVTGAKVAPEPVLPTMPVSAYAVPVGISDSSAVLRDSAPVLRDSSAVRRDSSEEGVTARLDTDGRVVMPTQILPTEGVPATSPPLPLPPPQPPEARHAVESSTPKPSVGERFRRAVLIGTGAAAIGIGIAAYPYLATLALITAVWILRSLSLTATAAGDRRRTRGPKWYDAPLAVLSSPWHLVAGIPGTLMLVLWSLGIALAAGLVGFALSLDALSTLVLTGASFAVSIWLGPGGSRVRGPVRRITDPASRGVGNWVAAMLVMLAFVGVPAWFLWQNGIDWSPASGGPLSRAPQWPDWLPR